MNDTSDHQYTTPTQPNRHASIQDDVPVVSQTQIDDGSDINLQQISSMFWIYNHPSTILR